MCVQSSTSATSAASPPARGLSAERAKARASLCRPASTSAENWQRRTSNSTCDTHSCGSPLRTRQSFWWRGRAVQDTVALKIALFLYTVLYSPHLWVVFGELVVEALQFRLYIVKAPRLRCLLYLQRRRKFLRRQACCRRRCPLLAAKR